MSFIYRTFAFAVIVLCLMYSFTVSIDPYEKFGINLWHLKTKAVYSDRDQKYYHLLKHKREYDFFVLGSSRAQYIDPEQIKDITSQNTYNFSVISGQPEDYLAITNYIIKTQIPKTIWLQLDFKNLNDYNQLFMQFKTSQLYLFLDHSPSKEKTEKTFLFDSTYLTLDSFLDSIRIVGKNMQKNSEQIIKENGMYARLPTTLFHTEHLESSYFDEYYKEYDFDQQRINYLLSIKELCDQYKIKLIVSISPMSTQHLTKILADPYLKPKFFDFKRKVVSIFGEVHDFNNFAVNQYDGFYWVDSVHLTPELAHIITSNMLSSKNNYFGSTLTNKNIEHYIANFNNNQSDFSNE
ncbi:hypothetical protein [Sulfuricurvum sp.]|uniref:hypothetical protein n=1 Tax=Sulfuricurvum sp. TaxID=2025608 RepID=UPI002633E658|nr:hypothetical protein [Sulfuricurvum sp.]MDD3595647.1 hypothetical protein [Sulfuricurvum sp.]MDD4883770.1 hypothetical protein [Sulfuricurvum sp.]